MKSLHLFFGLHSGHIYFIYFFFFLNEEIKKVSLSGNVEYCPGHVVSLRSGSDFDGWRAGGGLHGPIRRITVTRADVVSLAGTTQEAEETSLQLTSAASFCLSLWQFVR